MPTSYDSDRTSRKSKKSKKSRKNRKSREARPMTTTEYLQTPETVLPRELAYGVLHVADSPLAHHQRVVRDLVIAMAPFARDRQLGEVLPAPMDVILDFDAALVVQPDVLFISRERSHILTDRVYGAPDLVVEVLSPHTRVGKLDDRLAWFARYGVRECWLVDIPRREIVVLEFGEGHIVRRSVASGADRVVSSVLPDNPFTPQGLFGF